jgi:S-adenosylmethionine hydrolase
VEDISHGIKPADIAHAAFVLRAVFRDFPAGTVHLVGVDSVGSRDDTFIALQLEDHYFVGCDNGLFGLISDRPHQQLIELNTIKTASTTFPERDVFAHAACKLASGVSITNLGKPKPTFKKMIDRQVKATRKQITGSVIRVDRMGNLITNVPREAFDTLSKGKVFTVQFGGEKFRRIHQAYHQAEQGECFLVFNSLNLLEIGIYKGNAAELLGLGYDSTVNITFEE